MTFHYENMYNNKYYICILNFCILFVNLVCKFKICQDITIVTLVNCWYYIHSLQQVLYLFDSEVGYANALG